MSSSRAKPASFSQPVIWPKRARKPRKQVQLDIFTGKPVKKAGRYQKPVNVIKYKSDPSDVPAWIEATENPAYVHALLSETGAPE